MILYAHAASASCEVRLFDALGVCVDDRYEIEDGTIYALVDDVPNGSTMPPAASGTATAANVFFDEPSYISTEQGLTQIFAEVNLPRLGGASGDRGWSSVSMFQRCPHLWAATYVKRSERTGPEPMALQVGSLVHAMLAVHYQRLIDASYPLSPDQLRGRAIELRVDPAAVDESWRLFLAYVIHYGTDGIGTPRDAQLEPLAVEYHIVDPRTQRSARYDLIVRLPDSTFTMPAGTYVVEHKTSARFDDATLDGWRNDGEILGQIDLWETLKLDRRFGPLAGVLVNIIGKQKKPEFHRTMVSPLRWQTRDHRRTMRIWGAEIDRALATGVFPRARASCVGRFGKCLLFDACSEDKG